MYLGVKAVIAKSIERIHRANLINFGIVPFTFVNPKDCDRLSAGDKLEFCGVRAAIEGDGKIQVRVRGKDGDWTFASSTALSDHEKRLILRGGLLASL